MIINTRDWEKIAAVILFNIDSFTPSMLKKTRRDLGLLKKDLSQPKQIVITTHPKPDGDALGSSLGLYHYLIQKRHQVQVISPTDYPVFLRWLPQNELVLIYTDRPNESAQVLAQADLIFCLDFNALARVNELGELIRRAQAPKVMIDHHPDPEGFDDYRYWSVSACATAQLVFEFIKEMGDRELINKEVATCLYTGITTDSGTFRFANTNATVHRVAAELIDLGAENAKIHQLLYHNFSENRLRFLGHCLLNSLELIPELHTAFITVTKEDTLRYNILPEDTEGLVNYALSLHGVRLAALIIDRADQVKLSLRSVGEVPVNELCKKYFNGGGHKNAAGGSSDDRLEEVVEQLKRILPEYKAFLDAK